MFCALHPMFHITSRNFSGRQRVHTGFVLFLISVGLNTFFVLIPSDCSAQDIPDVAVMQNSEAPASEALLQDQNIQSETVPLSFAQPQEVLGILQPLTAQSGHIAFDENSNAVLLSGSPEKIQEMKKLISELDVQKFTMVFELGIAKASELSEKVQGLLTKNVGKVKFDDESNKLVITDTAAKIEEVRKVVEQLDRRDRQVLIDAKVVQIALNDEHRLGVDWEAIVSDYHSLKFTGQFSNVTDGEKRGQLSLGTIANEDYVILIEALDTVGKVEMLSSPSITAVHNKEVRILAGATQPYVTSDTSATAEGVNFIDIGVKLFVTPTIHADGSIDLKIRPEVSSVAGSVSAGGDLSAPVVETSQAETALRVKEGVTIVIGGLIKEEKSRLTKKVPILGDVPFLGMAFRTYSHSVKKTEIVIFLKPKLSNTDIK